MTQLGYLLLFENIAFMLLVLAAAWWSRMALPSQMDDIIGFPLLLKGDWWGNIILMSPVLYIAGKHMLEWSGKEMLYSLIFWFIISYLLFQFGYRKGKYPDALAGAGELHVAGWVMMFYTATALTFIGLFYTSADVTSDEVAAIGMLLCLYLPLANHVVLHWFKKAGRFPRCPDAFAEENPPILILFFGEIVVVLATLGKLAW
ncbi:MAG: hypothetical protein ACHQU0_02375 [Candidatus Paceibacteria bacterium]